jgi:hypothetical protein
VVIRKAERRDVPLLLEFIRGIAQYAKRFASITFQYSSDIQGCILKICLFGQKSAVKAMERQYCCITNHSGKPA